MKLRKRRVLSLRRRVCSWGGFSRAMGRFHQFLLDTEQLLGIRAGTGLRTKSDRRHRRESVTDARYTLQDAQQYLTWVQRVYGHCTGEIRDHLRYMPRELRHYKEALERVEGQQRAESGMLGRLK